MWTYVDPSTLVGNLRGTDVDRKDPTRVVSLGKGRKTFDWTQVKHSLNEGQSSPTFSRLRKTSRKSVYKDGFYDGTFDKWTDLL